MLKIVAVANNSVCAELEITEGNVLKSFDGHPANDMLDYLYYNAQESFVMEIEQNGEVTEFEVEKYSDEDLGLTFEEEELVPKRCANRCIFCFVDQLPKGLRDTLYFKDDDYRLSFISGNYVTLTNVTDKEIDKIIRYRLSPLYISVHTLNEDLRVKMTGNKRAGSMKKYLTKLSENNIKLNCQIVLCPNYNDREELINTLTELYSLSGAVESVAVVPVGLTAHRQNLPALEGVSQVLAGETIDLCEEFNKSHATNAEQFVFCSDEFYIRANRPLPPYEWYGSFAQIENGVGLVAKFQRDFEETLQETPKKNLNRHVTVITGMSARETIERAAKQLTEHFQELIVDVLPVENTFFGSSVTVTGLLTASDILKSKQKISKNSESVIITSCMLKEFETVFLDGMSVQELSEELQKEIFVSENTGKGFYRSIVGE